MFTRIFGGVVTTATTICDSLEEPRIFDVYGPRLRGLEIDIS